MTSMPRFCRFLMISLRLACIFGAGRCRRRSLVPNSTSAMSVPGAIAVSKRSSADRRVAADAGVCHADVISFLAQQHLQLRGIGLVALDQPAIGRAVAE